MRNLTTFRRHDSDFTQLSGWSCRQAFRMSWIDPEGTVDFLDSGRSRTTARIVDQAPEPTLWDRWVVQP
ncbi:hypothetical protein SBC1_40440 (plasmid) [Caballeronia sp. SBC1]|nr:hypothetical protein SBC2_47500 [Caballeronia sp. SBC2]QIN64004.1 hypothetical protein SBC1_40440 [Caballeronia sp. SBC1]